MNDASFLVCPDCEHTAPSDEQRSSPACGGDRTYLHHAPALPDASTEAAVELELEEAKGSGEASE